MELDIWHIWFVLAIGLFVIEIVISNFYAVCIGIGAVVSGIIAYSGYGTDVQLVSFFAVSILGIILLKVLNKKFLHVNLHESHTPRKSMQNDLNQID